MNLLCDNTKVFFNKYIKAKRPVLHSNTKCLIELLTLCSRTGQFVKTVQNSLFLVTLHNVQVFSFFFKSLGKIQCFMCASYPLLYLCEPTCVRSLFWILVLLLVCDVFVGHEEQNHFTLLIFNGNNVQKTPELCAWREHKHKQSVYLSQVSYQFNSAVFTLQCIVLCK